MDRPSEPVLEVLRGMRDRYRLARIVACLVGPFGGMTGYAMQRLQTPAFTSYPDMLGHPRSVKALDDPWGDGRWLEVIGQAQDLFAQRNGWELYHVFRNERVSNRIWWGTLLFLVGSTIAALSSGNMTVALVLMAASLMMGVVSVIGIAFSRHLVDWLSGRTDEAFRRLSRELPERLWPEIDRMRDKTSATPMVGTS